MNLRESFLQSGNKIEEIFERQVRVQTPNDVKLGDSFGVARRGRLPRLLQRHRVRTFGSLLATEGTQTARRNANVRWIDVAIHVEVRNVSMHPLTNPIRQPPYREQV